MENRAINWHIAAGHTKILTLFWTQVLSYHYTVKACGLGWQPTKDN